MYVVMVYSINKIYTVSRSNRITLMCRGGDAHHMYVCSWQGVLGKNVLCKLKFLWMFQGLLCALESCGPLCEEIPSDYRKMP